MPKTPSPQRAPGWAHRKAKGAPAHRRRGEGQPSSVGPAASSVPQGRSAAGAGPQVRSRRWASMAAIGFLVALTAMFFRPVLTKGQTYSILPDYSTLVYPWAAIPNDNSMAFPQTDYAELSYPWLVSTKHALEQGSLPFWSPNAYGGGYDFYSNGSAAVLYPPRLGALAVTSPVRTHDLFSIFHVAASAIAMFLLARELSLGRRAATFGAVAWMFATWNMAWLALEVVTPMSVFIPLSLLVVHKAVTRRSWPWAVVAGLVLGVVPVAGHVLLLGLVLFVAALYGGALVLSGLGRRAVGPAPAPVGEVAGAPASARLRALLADGARLVVAFGLAVGVSAIALVPTARALTAGQRDTFSYGQLRTLDMLAKPSMFTKLVAAPSVPPTADAMQYMGFVGTLTAGLAIIGACTRRRPGAWLGRCLVAVTFLVAVGTPATWLAYHLVPGMKVFRPYSRLTVFAAFGVALLGAIGLQAVLDRLQAPAGHHLPAHSRPRRWQWSGQRAQLAAHGVAALAIVVTGAQLARLGHQLNPAFSPNEARYTLPATPIIEQAKTALTPPSGWPVRVMPVIVTNTQRAWNSPVLYANTALATGLDTTSGYDSSLDRRTATLSRVLLGEEPRHAAAVGQLGAYNAAALSEQARFDLARRFGVAAIMTGPPRTDVTEAWSPTWADLGASRVYSGPDGELFAVPGPLVGPRLVGADVTVDGDEEALVRFADPTFPADTTVIVEPSELRRAGVSPLGPGTGEASPGASGEASGGASAAASVGTVESAERGVNSVHATVNATTDAWLVIPDAWAEGWRATVNGKPSPVVRVNYNQRAVRVPAGQTTITMRYRSPGFNLGALLSALSLGAAAAALAYWGWKRLRGSGASTLGAGTLQLEDELVAEEAGSSGNGGPVQQAQGPPASAASPVGQHVER